MPCFSRKAGTIHIVEVVAAKCVLFTFQGNFTFRFRLRPRSRGHPALTFNNWWKGKSERRKPHRRNQCIKRYEVFTRHDSIRKIPDSVVVQYGAFETFKIQFALACRFLSVASVSKILRMTRN